MSSRMQIKRLKKSFKQILHKVFPGAQIMKLREEVRLLSEYTLQAEISRRQREHPNPFCRFGAFGFSQADEDGITLEIVRRLQIDKGRFLELGVGDGLENNTLILLASGWRGVWLGGEDLRVSLKKCKRLKFEQAWITRDNVIDLIKKNIGHDLNLDLVSLDLDGNDLFVAETMLEEGVSASIFIVEYNSRFPGEVDFSIDYDPQHTWTGGDYYGASLQAFCNLFERFGYSLICCNAATGGNAFFVQTNNLDKFPEVPKNRRDIYSSPFFYVPNIGHVKSVKTIQKVLDSN